MLCNALASILEQLLGNLWPDNTCCNNVQQRVGRGGCSITTKSRTRLLKSFC